MSEASEHPDRAIVFDVQRACVHDGPGLRTVVFFKGCSLACVWCQNPEGRRHAPELAYYENRCVPGCSLCVDVCPELALREQMHDRVDWSRCTHCGLCESVCPSGALTMVGRAMSADELLAEVSADAPFYAATGGGITLSGGEPILHAAFLRRFLPAAKRAGLHVAIETGGNYPFELLEPLLPEIDLILFDVKAGTSTRHHSLTGHGNERVLANLRRLIELRKQGGDFDLEVRMPVIPTLNATDESVDEIAACLRALGVDHLTLLPYNAMWEAKLPHLASEQAPLGIRPQPGLEDALVERFGGHGIVARAQG